jgi:hypothetical protein
MSIVGSLKWLFDPATDRYEQGEKAAERELPAAVEDGDPPSFDVPPVAADGVQYECKVCGGISGDPAFCYVCLAATQRPR